MARNKTEEVRQRGFRAAAARRAAEEEKAEQQELNARHRPDERAPNEPAGPAGSGAGDIYAAGAPGGGSAVGGLAGTNVGDGSPDNADIDAAGGSSEFDVALDADEEEGYAGVSGGAVGGTPAGKRARGGRAGGGIRPEGGHRGDSTVGGNPSRGPAET